MGSNPVKGTISGSSAATVIGFSKYTSPFQIWQRIMEDIEPGFNKKRGYDYQVFEGNAATRWGNAFEVACIITTESKIGKKIIDQEKEYYQVFCKKNDIDFQVPISCHIDGRFSGSKTMYEGKTAYERGYRLNWGDPGTDKIPRDYQVQAHHNMFLSGCDETIFSVLVWPKSPAEWEDEGWKVEERKTGYVMIKENYGIITSYRWAEVLSEMGYHHIYKVKRNEKLIKSMHDKYAEFWENYVLPKKPPKPMNVEDIKRLCPNPCGTIIVNSDFQIKLLKEYSEITKEIGNGGTLAKRKETIKKTFLERVMKKVSTADEESTDKWLFVDTQGNKLGSWGKDKRGYWALRT
jgi:predicted phage-related endonuclease